MSPIMKHSSLPSSESRVELRKAFPSASLHTLNTILSLHYVT